MDQKLRKQIKAYAGIAGAVLYAEKTNAQVHYVDINPDTTVILTTACCGVYFYWDMDNNTSTDFGFNINANAGTSTSGVFSSIGVYPFNNNKILRDTLLSGHPLAMQNGDYIGNTGNWALNNPTLINYVFGFHLSGNWFVGDNKCLGIQYIFGGQIHYGWIHLEIITAKEFKIKEYAYQLQPNVPMLACDTTNLATSISEYNNLQFNFSHQNNSVHISTFQKLNHVNILVYDLLGKEILQQLFEEKETTITIDKKGIYFIEVKSEKGIFRKKIFIY